MLRILLTCGLLFAIGMTLPLNAKPVPAAAALPADIERLKQDIAGKSPGEVLKIITDRFGEQSRDVGSGVRIPEWDIAGGTLTYHPHTGVFWAAKGDVQPLVTTHNPAGETIFRGYEMVTLPHKKFNGTRFWLGNVTFAPDGTYAFTDSESNKGQREDQGENYFLLHPAGKYESKYAPGVTAETLLETLPPGATVAHLTLTSADGKTTAGFVLKNNPANMAVEFAGKDAGMFHLRTHWANYWK